MLCNANSHDRAMQCGFEGQMVIKDYPRFLAELVGIIVDVLNGEPSV